MRGSAYRTSALATMLYACCISAAAQDYGGREKLRAQSNEITNGSIQGVGWSTSDTSTDLQREHRSIAALTAWRDHHAPPTTWRALAGSSS